jgi:predicted NAD-dependent protein-ADP-ribosyltransferase YbiA (DUF1768 family)
MAYSRKRNRKLKHQRNTNNKRRKSRKSNRGGTRYNSGKELPFMLTYKDIVDNSDYLMELPYPTDSKSYEVNQIYIIQQSMTNMPDSDYKKIIVKSILPNELSIIPVLSKGKKYSKYGNVPKKIQLKSIQYAYKVMDSGYVEFSKLSEKMQDDESFKIKSSTPAYQKVLQTKELPDHIKSFFQPPTVVPTNSLPTKEKV